MSREPKIVLSDDGTLDTVLSCQGCGKEFRYNFDDDNEPRGEDSSAAYDRFVEWAIDDVGGQHDCGREMDPSDHRTPVSADNYGDAARGLYWFASDNHSGQTSELYSILSARLGYEPSPSERGPDCDDSGTFYAELSGEGWDPTELCAAIATYTGKEG